MVFIRAKQPNLTTLNATLANDEIGECPADRAKELVRLGLAEIVAAPPARPATPPKTDTTERAVSPARTAAETQVKKG
jgi:hypothetical protein